MSEKAFIKENQIIIPKSGNAPMLLLEWISEESPSGGINMIIGVFDNHKDNRFEITINPNVYDLSNCVEYINANL
jgi:hypothetical protein